MKKYFEVLLLAVLLGLSFNTQASDIGYTYNSLPDNGVLVSGSIRLCNYEKACLITDSDMKFWTQALEISYDSSDKYYGIYIKCHGDIINLAVKYVHGSEGAYVYEGYDRITNREVVVVTKQKLSSYLNNNGVNSHLEVNSEDGIIVTAPATYTVFSLCPIKNK